MEIKEIKKMMRDEFRFFATKEGKLERSFLENRINAIFNLWKRDKKIDVDEKTRKCVIKEICDDFLGYGPISELLSDPDVTEIMVNGPEHVYMEKHGLKTLSNVKFDDYVHLRYVIERMIMASGRRVDESSPYADFSLEDGSRVNVVIPPLSVEGPMITIRKMLYTIDKIEDLIALGTIDERMAQFLVACIKGRLNIIFSGATGSGKTTTLEVLSSYAEHDERIITIEDALELKLRQQHVVRLLSRPPNIEGKGEVSIRDLFINSLRMRPTRIILGEIRGAEAMDYLQALNSGHKGCLAVVHASTPQDVLTRLETMALYSGLNLPYWAIRKQIAFGLDVIVQHEQLIDGTRKINFISEIAGLDGDEIELKDIFRYEIERVDKDHRIRGRSVALNMPKCLSAFKKRGINLDKDIFKE